MFRIKMEIILFKEEINLFIMENMKIQFLKIIFLIMQTMVDKLVLNQLLQVVHKDF